MATNTITAEQAAAYASEKIEALETALAAGRHLQARAIVTMRADGYRWKRIEKITGMNRDRLKAIALDYRA